MPFDGRFWGQSVDVKVVIFGLAISSSWGNGHATPWRGLCSALITQGHRVVFFERDTEWYAAHRDLHHLPGGRLVLYSGWADVLPAARRELADADAGIVTSYCPDALVASALLMRSTVAVRAFYDLDTPVTLANLAAGQGVPYVGTRGLGDYDLVLSYTGGAALDGLCQQLGARRVAPLYGSVNPAVHHEVDPALPTGATCPTLARSPPTDRPRWRNCSSHRPGSCRNAASSWAGAAILRASPGRRTSTSCGTCRPPSIPPFTARAA